MKRSKVKGFVVTSIAAATLLGLASEASFARSASNVIQVSKQRGVQQIGDLRISRGYFPTNLRDATEVLGNPKRLRRPYREVCEAYFGKGLRLDFVSFGLASSCYDRSLQAGLIRSRHWKLRVGKRFYRVGMPKRRVPSRARFVPRYGYELANFRFVTGRTGSVYALIGGAKRIRAFRLFIGLAGD